MSYFLAVTSLAPVCVPMVGTPISLATSLTAMFTPEWMKAEHGDGLLARHQPAVGGNALLVLAGAVVDRQRDLASEHAALLIDVLGADLGAALGELAQRRLARWLTAA